MHRDLLLDQEIVRINEQHKRELATHEISINIVRDELRHQQKSREAQDGEIAVLKALVEQLMRQVKGKGKASDPTPEASGAGGGRPPPPRHGAAGAPGGRGGGDPDDEGEGSGRKPDENRKGRRGERPAPQPEEDDYDVENNTQFNLFSRVMDNALGQRTRVPAEPPAMFRNEKHQDIRMWLMTCTDYFGRKQLAVGGRGTTNPIRHKPNGRERSHTVCVNVPMTNDRRNRLYETRRIRVLACFCRTSPATLRTHP